MGKYYYLIAGLPTLSFDGGKPPYTVSGFKEELTGHLSKSDLRLLEILFLKADNKNLLEQLQYPDYEPYEGGKFTVEELNALITGLQKEIDGRKTYLALKEEAKNIEDHIYEKPKIPPPPPPFRNKNRRLPTYFVKFAKMYLNSVSNEETTTVPWEDRLSSLYYEHAMKRSNAFIAEWFELNLNIINIFTALTCRKYKLDRENYIVGDTVISNKLRSSKARDFELGETLEYLPSIVRIAEETDLMQRELKTDLFRWEWLDRQIVINVFGIESVLTYMLKIEMLEHWTNLDKTTGDKAFRQLVGDMKKSSKHTLEEFKRNNKK